MEAIQVAVTFLGWCSVINLAIYLITALMLMAFRGPVKALHSKLTAVPEEKLNELYFSYLSRFKIAIIIFNIVPYLALKLTV